MKTTKGQEVCRPCGTWSRFSSFPKTYVLGYVCAATAGAGFLQLLDVRRANRNSARVTSKSCTRLDLLFGADGGELDEGRGGIPRCGV